MSDSEEKTLAPSQRKLRKAREKGQIARFADLVTAGGLAAGTAYLAFSLDEAAVMTDVMALALDRMSDPPDVAFATILSAAIGGIARYVGSLVALLAGLSIVVNLVMNKGFLFTTDALSPKLSNLSPMKGFGRIFGLRAGVELIKSLLRMAVAMVAVWGVYRIGTASLIHAPDCGLGCAVGVILTLLALIAAVLIVIALIAAIIDIRLQVWLFMRDQKMSRSEQKAEQKESFGSPEIRKARKRLRNEAASSTGTPRLDRATIVIAGADDVAALRYDKSEYGVPVLMAKGRGGKAAPLLEAAMALGVPVYDHSDLATALCRKTGKGQPIKQGEFAATAKAIMALQHR
ncbi:MAG: EscU/YscU/HrcU family type III secretion system export apparatus switch protein [Pseudomonadota bacterium]